MISARVYPRGDAVEEAKGVAEVALAGGVRADQEDEVAQVQLGVFEVLKPLQAKTVDHGATPFGGNGRAMRVAQPLLTYQMGGILGSGLGAGNAKTPGALRPRGFLWIKSGNTYSRTFGTTIGSESLTTVFGMGTGVAFQIWSPERSGGPD